MKNGSSYMAVQEVIAGRLWVYLRADTGSSFYYARAKFPPQKGYKVFSTKSSSQHEAVVIAQNRYYELAGRASLNITTRTQSLTTLMKEYLDYKDRLRNRSKDHKTKYREIYERFIRPYFGQMKVPDLHAMSQNDMQDYWQHRTTYWKHRSASPQMIKSRYGNNRAKYMNAHRMAEREVSYTTLQIEVQLFRSFYKWAVANGHMLARNVPDVVNPVPKIDKETANLRGLFEDWEYEKVKKEVMANAQHFKKQNASIQTSSYRYRAEMLYCYFFTAAAFGARPQELKKLKFSHVKLIKDEKTGNYYSVIDLPSELAKANPDGSRKGRRIYSFDNHLAYNRIHERWKSYLTELHGPFDESKMHIFPKWMPCKDRYNEYFSNQWIKPKKYNPYTEPARMDWTFRNLLQKLNMHRDEDGRPRSSYSLRKYYITQRVRANVPLAALAINTGHDIQTLWKWYMRASSDDMREYLTKRDPNQYRQELKQVDAVEDTESFSWVNKEK